MADFNLFNIDTDPPTQYTQYDVPQAINFSQTFIGDSTTIVNNINGASGPNITFTGAAIGVAFTGSAGGTVTMSISNAALFRAAISAAKSGVNTDITQLNGASQVDVSTNYKVSGTQVVQQRDTGWTNPTGVASKAGYDTSTATLTQVAETLKALIDALSVHGLIGT